MKPDFFRPRRFRKRDRRKKSRSTSLSNHADWSHDRLLARTLRGRLVGRKGAVAVFGESPNADRLLDWIRNLEDPAAVGDALFTEASPFTCTTILSAEDVAVRLRAAARWMRSVRVAINGEPRRKKRIRLEQEFVEASQLYEVAVCLAQRDQLCGDAWQLLYSPAVASEVACSFDLIPAHLDDRARVGAVLVAWAHGQSGLLRFLEAIEQIPDPVESVEVRRYLAVAARCDIFAKRISENHEWLSVEWEWVEGSLHESIRTDHELSRAMSETSLSFRFRRLAKLCRDRVDAIVQGRAAKSVQAIAALCVTDGSNVPIPKTLARDLESLIHVSNMLAFSDRIDFEETLQNFDDWCHECVWRELGHVADGASWSEIQWAIQRDCDPLYADSAMTLDEARRFTELLGRHGISLTDSDIATVMRNASDRPRVRAFQQFGAWLAALPKSYSRESDCSHRVDFFLKQVVPAIGDFALIDLCQKWFGRQLRAQSRQVFVDGLSRQHHGIRDIVFVRQLAGRAQPLPAMWRNQMNSTAKLRGEIAWLRQSVSNGNASQEMIARLAALETRMESSQDRESRIADKLSRRFFRYLSEAFREDTRRECQAIWENASGGDAGLGGKRPEEWAAWVSRMKPADRLMLVEILQAATRHGDNYREQLPANRRWLKKASRRLKVVEWMSPKESRFEIDGRDFRIVVSREPLQTFLMGEYFGSCLSFDGENAMSVLANTHDANKHVIYLFDANGNVVGRKLVTISAKWEMLGYNDYLSVPNSSDELRQKLIDQLHRFCGQWAARCGIGLSSEGEPEQIGDWFWWDDGEEKWADAAVSARSETRARFAVKEELCEERDQAPVSNDPAIAIEVMVSPGPLATRHIRGSMVSVVVH